MMQGAVVAIKAAENVHLGGELAGNSCVARVALFFENGVRLREAAAAVNARVFKNGALGDPNERKQR